MAMHTDKSQHDFGGVVALNQGARDLLSLSYRVNLLAIDAMLQSKRGGGDLKGFDEVSSQMRSWTRDLHDRLEELNVKCQAVVARTSLYCRRREVLRLLEAAVAQSGNADLQRALGQLREGLKDIGAELDSDWRIVRGRLADLDQQGTMAVVLSRSAMIEAATGGAEQRAQLGQVSKAFYEHSQSAVQTLKSLLRQFREE